MGLPQLDAGLFFNASKRSDRNVSLGVNDRNAAWFRQVLELLMAAGLIDFKPAVSR
jgi:hypothetical protein